MAFPDPSSKLDKPPQAISQKGLEMIASVRAEIEQHYGEIPSGSKDGKPAWKDLFSEIMDSSEPMGIQEKVLLCLALDAKYVQQDPPPPPPSRPPTSAPFDIVRYPPFYAPIAAKRYTCTVPVKAYPKKEKKKEPSE